MKMPGPIIALCLLLLPFQAVHAFQSSPAPKWSERGVFVFGYLVVDFQIPEERYYQYRSARIQNCSNEEFYCISGGWVFQLALPKKCGPIHVGDSWGVGDISVSVLSTKVEGSDLDIHRTISKTTYWVGSERRSNTVYRYDPRLGVIAVMHDPAREVDLVGMAKKGDLPDISTLSRPGSSAVYFPLTTFDLFGQCR
jgi:hypothetical protein